MIKKYLQYWTPGSFISNSNTKEIESNDYKKEIPDNAFQWRTYEIEHREIDGRKFHTEPFNFSKIYIRGEILTLEKIKQLLSSGSDIATKTLLDNMERNDWNKVILSPNGQIYPLSENHIVVGD